VIAWGREPDVLLRLAARARRSARCWWRTQKKQARKQWMADHLQLRGAVTVDAGAVLKLRDEGKSLLPIGMTAVEGDSLARRRDCHPRPMAALMSSAWPTTPLPRRLIARKCLQSMLGSASEAARQPGACRKPRLRGVGLAGPCAGAGLQRGRAGCARNGAPCVRDATAQVAGR
jgi:hypothetical protein